MTVEIRPLESGDGTAFLAFVNALSAQARLDRFFAPIRELAPTVAAALTHPDQRRHVALVATADGRIVGEARFVMLDGDARAEFALAVADEWQRQGIGARLLETLVDAARRTGLRTLEGEILRTNVGMQHFMKRAGFRIAALPGDARLVLAVRELERIALAA